MKDNAPKHTSTADAGAGRQRTKRQHKKSTERDLPHLQFAHIGRLREVSVLGVSEKFHRNSSAQQRTAANRERHRHSKPGAYITCDT